MLVSLDAALEVILMLANCESNLGLIWLAANTAYAEVRRTKQLVYMVRLNLAPIAVPDNIPGMFKPAIQMAMEPAEERAIGSSILTISADLLALATHLKGVCYLLECRINGGA